jgi:hypothetical protein
MLRFRIRRCARRGSRTILPIGRRLRPVRTAQLLPRTRRLDRSMTIPPPTILLRRRLSRPVRTTRERRWIRLRTRLDISQIRPERLDLLRREDRLLLRVSMVRIRLQVLEDTNGTYPRRKSLSMEKLVSSQVISELNFFLMF